MNKVINKLKYLKKHIDNSKQIGYNTDNQQKKGGNNNEKSHSEELAEIN